MPKVGIHWSGISTTTTVSSTRNTLKGEWEGFNGVRKNVGWIVYRAVLRIQYSISVLYAADFLHDIAHLEEQVDLSAVCRVVHVRLGNVDVTVHSGREVGYVRGLVHIERLGHLLLVVLEPFGHFFDFFWSVMFLVFHLVCRQHGMGRV